ncbi:MAG: GNAT family N-acetyltransferase [Erythrobacter sp.]|nr:GNAT family N-acetyltransferase [Erythrobacter sp.]
MNNWTLRLARPDDAEAMPGIESAAAGIFADLPDYAHLNLKGARTADSFRRLIRKGHCLVAHVGETMAGYLVAEPFRRELHIWQMDVVPQFQRRGIGSGLVRAGQIDARNTGFAALTLTTFRDVPWNGPFYARLGFEEVTAIDAHMRLAGELANEADDGLPITQRCAMICFLD